MCELRIFKIHQNGFDFLPLAIFQIELKPTLEYVKKMSRDKCPVKDVPWDTGCDNICFHAVPTSKKWSPHQKAKDIPSDPMKNVSRRFQNWSIIFSASVHSPCMGLWHGIDCQRKLTHLFVKFVNESTLACWLWRIIVKRPRMLSTQFVALYKPCKPKPNLNLKIDRDMEI